MTDRDERWQALQDALAIDEAEALPPELDARATSLWRDELDFYDALARHATTDAEPHPKDASIVEAALLATDEPAPRRHAPYGWIAAVVAVAAAAVLWIALPGRFELRGAEGSWASEAGDTIASGDRMHPGVWLRVGDDACMARGPAKLCAGPQTRLRILDPDDHAIELAAGSVEVRAGAWSVELSGVVHRLDPGESLEVATHLASTEPEPEPEPEPESEPEPEPPREPEPEIVEPAPPSKRRTPRPTADAATLVERARQARGAGRLREAEHNYGTLLRRFPSSSEAAVGRVALAQIKLRRGQVEAALRLFGAAARGGGPLAEEGAWGRIQALDRLGRKAELREAVDDFVAKYPTSAYRARAQGRAAQ